MNCYSYDNVETANRRPITQRQRQQVLDKPHGLKHWAKVDRNIWLTKQKKAEKTS